MAAQSPFTAVTLFALGAARLQNGGASASLFLGVKKPPTLAAKFPRPLRGIALFCRASRRGSSEFCVNQAFAALRLTRFGFAAFASASTRVRMPRTASALQGFPLRVARPSSSSRAAI